MSGRDAIPPSPSDAEYASEADAAPEDIFAREDPVALFGDWLAEARKREPNDPNAMALGTADGDGLPDVRMVLLKDVDARGFTFYTNTQSAKGLQLETNSKAALCFHWKSLRRQVRVRGAVEPVSDAEADAYFASRARDSRIGAGPASSLARWKAGLRWRKPWPPTRPNSISAISRARTSGPDIASFPCASSSGVTAPSACMTGWCSSVTARTRPGV